jgi:hypothetical protein
MANMRVIKTLVVGLGSTGTRVCNALAERMEWEVGQLTKAPWVEFLCIETNAQEKSRFNPSDNFKTLSLNASEYSDVLNNPANYNDSIALENWADINTLRQLKAGAVDAGAGNIRMVGRLALLYPRNFINIKNALSERLARLRNLTPAQAKTALNKDAIGHEQEVIFADGIRIIVTGTLLGGTCSGTAADMGILLQTISQKEERVMGIFTLPHPQYSIANDSSGYAELRKVNAYHALQELNQYQNYTDHDRYRTIKHYDKAYGEAVLAPDETPFDLIYLVRSRESTPEDENKVNNAVADRIFLNVFVPEADPMAQVVDGGVTPPNRGRSFAFSTFGLSTIEYPVRRIIEACKLKLLAHAFRNFKERPLTAKLEDVLDDQGLTTESLIESLLLDESNTSIKNRLEGKQREIINAARTGNTEAARKALEEYRSAFIRDKGEGFKGLAVRTIESNRSRAANDTVQRFAGFVKSQLQDYDAGPNPALIVLDGVAERLGELRAWEGNEIKPGAVGNVLDRIEMIKKNTLLGFFALQNKAIAKLLNTLNRALNDEARARLEQAAKTMLRDSGSGVRTDTGVLNNLDTELSKMRKRVSNLKNRIESQALEWSGEAGKLEGRDSGINGLSLFDPAPNGTVDAEFRHAIPDDRLERIAAGVIREWADLPKSILPNPNENDWLLQPYVPGKAIFDPNQLQTLERIAVEPFRGIADPNNKDVTTRLYEKTSPTFSPEQESMAAANAAAVFLPITENLGQPDPMSPLPKKKLLLGLNLSPAFSSAITQWRTAAPSAKEIEINNPYRIVMLEEWHKYNLRGALDISNLANARSNLYPTYFTRKRDDIDWTPISDSEVAQLRDAEDLLTFGLLNDILRLEYGYLVIDWQANIGENTDPAQRQRRFPARMERAARMLAFSNKDARGNSLDNVRTRLDSLIKHKYRTEFIEKHKDTLEAQQAYIRYLSKQLLESNARVVEGWNHANATKMIVAHCRQEGLLKALYTVYPPEEALLESLFRRKGDPRPKGGFYAEDGYYCIIDGGLVGKTRDEALENGLACQFYPEHPMHPFGREWNAFGVYQ